MTKRQTQKEQVETPSNYIHFLQTRSLPDEGHGIEVKLSDLNPMLFDFQKDITRWSLHKGRTLIGLNCGLGKGPIQMEWLKQVHNYTDKPVIMFAPPGVKYQFANIEAPKFGYEVNIANEESEIINGINITNYERLMVREKINRSELNDYMVKFSAYNPSEVRRTPEYIEVERFRFNPDLFGGIALDEGSILKHYGSKTRERLTEFAKNIHYRIVGTATPAPNDYMELINYAEFLGIMNGKQIRAMYFIQDGQTSIKYRIKKPAWKPFWKWVSSWSVMIRYPSDLGYEDDGYILPEMNMHLHTIEDTNVPEGMLFAVTAKSLSEQSKVKRGSVEERCIKAAEIVNNSDEIFIVWCERNDESSMLKKLIPGAIEVTGSDSDDHKEKTFMEFAQGKHRVIITKPSMGGLGMNWQVCGNQVFTSIDHSHEKQYQAIRRSWRFGRNGDVNIYLIAMNTEGDILSNIKRKERQADTMFREIVSQMDVHDLQRKHTKKEIMEYQMAEHKAKHWELKLGDSVERLKELDDKSIGCVVTSVPFPAMYSYTNSERDIGNYNTVNELIDHLKFVFISLLPKMMPGRICHIHIAQAVAHLNREGVIGLMDFRGPLIQMMVDAGWIFHGERTIEKDPQTERARNNTLGLMQKTLMNDASHMRASVSDYLIEFRSPGENPEEINALLSKSGVHGNYDSPDGWITMDMWINWASNVWYKHRRGMKWWEGIDVTNVCGAIKKEGRQGFGVKEGKGKDDEKHLCELQLDVIERCIALHSNPGDLVCDPFNGIGSTGMMAVQMGRQYVGIELKDSYYYTAIKNMQWAESQTQVQDLFSMINQSVNYKDGKSELWDIHRQWMSKRGISLDDRATYWESWDGLTIDQIKKQAIEEYLMENE